MGSELLLKFFMLLSVLQLGFGHSFTSAFGNFQFDYLGLLGVSVVPDFQAGSRCCSINWKRGPHWSWFLLHWGRFIVGCWACSKVDQESKSITVITWPSPPCSSLGCKGWTCNWMHNKSIKECTVHLIVTYTGV